MRTRSGLDNHISAAEEPELPPATDDGRAFDTSVPRFGPFGLQSMRERGAAVGGTVAMASAIGGGTQVRVSIPVPVDSDG